MTSFYQVFQHIQYNKKLHIQYFKGDSKNVVLNLSVEIRQIIFTKKWVCVKIPDQKALF